MRRRMAGSGARHGVAQERLLYIGVLMRRDGAEGRRARVAAEAGVDVERAVQLERQVVAPREAAQHVHDAGPLGPECSPDTVAAVAREAGPGGGDPAAGIGDWRAG